MAGHISYSQMKMFRRCPRQWYYRYSEGIILPPAVVMIAGSSYHKALEESFRNVLLNGTLHDTAQALDVFSDKFDEQAKGEVFYSEDDVQQGKKKILAYHKDGTARALKNYHSTVAPTLKPLAVESEFTLAVKNPEEEVVTVKGYIDLPEAKDLVDFKLKQKRPTELDLDTTQLILYDRGYTSIFGHKPEKIRYDFSVYTKTGQTCYIAEAKADAPDGLLWDEVFTIKKAIDSGIFYPCAPDSWGCSRKWCGYFDLCKFGSKRALTFTIKESQL